MSALTCRCRWAALPLGPALAASVLAATPVRAVSQTPPLATEQPAVRPYRDRFITLDDVRLYVADWGGTGPLLVFLPGFGSGAHIFDGLASAFTDRFHVVAVTPRGFPPSSAPDSGYTIAQLADDVRGLLDSLGARSAVLAGHSISGAVITRFAEAYPNRLRAAVYLDAAFDFAEAYRNSRTAPRMGPPGSLDTTAARYRAWREAYPDWDPIRETDAQMWDLDSAEVARRQRLAWALAEEVRSAPHEFWKVQVPALSICALGSLERSYGWMTPDSTRWDSVVAYAKEALPRQSTRCNEFRRRVPQGQSIALDSGHFVFLDRRDAVVQAMRRFLRAALR